MAKKVTTDLNLWQSLNVKYLNQSSKIVVSYYGCGILLCNGLPPHPYQALICSALNNFFLFISGIFSSVLLLHSCGMSNEESDQKIASRELCKNWEDSVPWLISRRVKSLFFMLWLSLFKKSEDYFLARSSKMSDPSAPAFPWRTWKITGLLKLNR